MKLITGLLIVLFIVLQYKLWFNHTGVAQTLALQNDVAKAHAVNQQLKARNQALQAEVNDLRSGHVSIEGKAREELGMVKPGEQFYQILKPSKPLDHHK